METSQAVDPFKLYEPAPSLNRVVRGMPEREYFAADGISNSTLGRLELGFHFTKIPLKPSQDLAIGSAVHTKVLTPQDWEKDFVVLPEIDWRKKSDKELIGQFIENELGLKAPSVTTKTGILHFLAHNSPKTVLTQESYETVLQVADAIAGNEDASRLLEQLTDVEVSCFATDAETGLLRKGRIDGVITSSNCLIDLKTTVDASYAEFSHTINKRRYHRQAAYYIDLWNQLNPDQPVHRFLFLAAEKSGEFGVNVFELSPQAIEAGRRMYQRLLREYPRAKAAYEKHPSVYAPGIKVVERDYWSE